MDDLIKKLQSRKKGYISKQATLKQQLKEVNERIQRAGFSNLYDLEKRLILNENAVIQGRMAELDYILKQIK